MNRVRKGSIIVLSLLIIGLVISVHGAIPSGAAKTEVIGILDLKDPTYIDLGEAWVDKGGKMHIRNMVVEGTFEFTTPSSENIAAGTVRLSITTTIDEAGNGPSHGWFINYDGEDDSILWEGSWDGRTAKSIFSGKLQGAGHGSFAGTRLKGTLQASDSGGDPADTSILSQLSFEGRLLTKP